MIDLHSHILPMIDDGSKSMEMSIEMAKMAVADGTKILACTPHFLPPKYPTTVEQMEQGITRLQSELDQQGIALKLIRGGDLHIASDMGQNLANKSLPTLGTGRFFLFEPDHHILAPHMEHFCNQIIKSGFHPILTHPERLTWIEQHYDVVRKLSENGVAIQLTAASITGRFGARPQYWSERMLDEGHVDIIASDAHNIRHRPPGLSKARNLIEIRCGSDQAKKMVIDNPIRILKNETLIKKSPRQAINKPQKKSIFQKVFSRN